MLIDYRDSVRRYADAVRTLVDMISLESSDRGCRNAHERTEEARLKLFRHEANHLCDRSDFTSVPV